MEDLSGKQFGPYQLMKATGEGGTATSTVIIVELYVDAQQVWQKTDITIQVGAHINFEVVKGMRTFRKIVHPYHSG